MSWKVQTGKRDPHNGVIGLVAVVVFLAISLLSAYEILGRSQLSDV
jgi:hypothetical protein